MGDDRDSGDPPAGRRSHGPGGSTPISYRLCFPCKPAPRFADRSGILPADREILPLPVAYHNPVINYGHIVEAGDAELYGATLPGPEVEAYHQALCELADSMPAADDHG